VITSFWFSSVAVGFTLFSHAGAKYEDIRFMTGLGQHDPLWPISRLNTVYGRNLSIFVVF
jgi:hypothetical protein